MLRISPNVTLRLQPQSAAPPVQTSRRNMDYTANQVPLPRVFSRPVRTERDQDDMQATSGAPSGRNAPPATVHESEFDIPFSKLRLTSTPEHTFTPGPFQLVECIQTGGAGQAVVVRELGHLRPERVLCLKVIQKKYVLERQLADGIVEELLAYKRLAASQKHMGSAYVMDLDAAMQDEERLYFGMQLMAHDLSAVMTATGRRRHANARLWLTQIIMGISFIHDSGIIHRDIKPQNLLLDGFGNIRISDFNCAYLHSWHTPLRAERNYCSDVVGTTEYMAPEVSFNQDLPVADRRKYGVGVDYWGAGCVFFELVSDFPRALFVGKSELLQYEHWDREREGETFLSAIGVDPEVHDVMDGLVCVDADERFHIKDLWRHPYFRNGDGTTMFGILARQNEYDGPRPPGTLRPMHHSFDPPYLYSPEVDPPPNAHPFEQFGWINPKGMWGEAALLQECSVPY